MQKKFQQTGATLLEALAALTVLSGVMIGAAQLTDSYLNDTKAITAAQQTRSIGEAAKAYIAANRANVIARATPTTPCLIRASDLTTYLPGVTGTNSFGQNIAVLVLEPTANNLTPLVVTYGGTAPTDAQLPLIANAIGAEGGAVYSTNANLVQGVGNAWQLNLAAAPHNAYRNAPVLCATGVATGAITITTGSNAMSLWVADESIGSAFLYRDSVAGRPELNTMNTPLIMASAQVTDDVCTVKGAIARDTDGKVSSCVDIGAGVLRWKAAGGSAYWGDPVANYVSLPATGNQPGTVRMTVDTGRGFMWTGATWNALAVDQNGDLTVPRHLTVTGNLAANGNVTLGDAAGDSVTVNGAMQANNGLRIGNGTAATSTNTLVIDRTASEGGACSPNGSVARDANGLLLSCQSGSWKNASSAVIDMGALSTRSVIGSAFHNGWGSATAYASCSADEAITGCSGNGNAYISGKTCVNIYSCSDCGFGSSVARATCVK